MKKLILITGILLSTSLWASPMDKVCSVNTIDSSYTLVIETISKCERNNILSMWGNAKENFEYDNLKSERKLITYAPLSVFIKLYCRYDRNVNKTESPDMLWSFDCVLYDNEPRENIKD